MVWFYPFSFLVDFFYFLELSIPLWSDFITLLQWVASYKSVFQSHYGLILSLLLLCNPCIQHLLRPFNPTMVWFYRIKIISVRGVKGLSIPLWSDFILLAKQLLNFLEGAFQSHYGLILSRYLVPKTPEYENHLSIPLWSDFIVFVLLFCFF